jgi:hypothetical protein
VDEKNIDDAGRRSIGVFTDTGFHDVRK